MTPLLAMDYQLLTRVESHATDLFKLGQELGDDTEDEHKELRLLRKKGPLLREAAAAAAASKPTPRKAKRAADDSKTTPMAAKEAEASPKGFSRSKSVPFSLSTVSEVDEENESENEEVRTRSPAHAKSSPLISVARKDAVKTPKLSEDLFQSWISMRRITLEEQQRIHYEDLFGCFTRNFGKGFALGFGGKVLLNVFSELVSSLRTRRFHWHIFTRSVEGAKDHGLFLALLLATHNSIMYVSRDSKHEHARYRGSVAGFIAGLLSLAYLPHAMRRSVILFTFVRAFELSCRILAKRKVLPSLEHGDTALMSASSAVMIYTWLFHPNALDKSYVHFLTRQVQVPVPIVRAIAHMQAGLPLENLAQLNAARHAVAPKDKAIKDIVDALGYDSPLLSTAEKAGNVLHPGQSFGEFASKYFVRGLRNAAPVYAPVYAVPLVLFSRKRLIRDPFNTLKSAAMGASRSTLFLAAYCTLGICSMSFGRRIGFRYDVLGKLAMIMPFLCGAIAGTATIIEKRSRRIELALYVMSKAVEGVHGVIKEKLGERIASPPLADTFFFAACFSVISHANLRHPELVREAYRALLMRFFDTDERHKFL